MRLIMAIFILLLTASPARSGQTDTRSMCLSGDLLSCSLVLARGGSRFSTDHALKAVAEGFAEAGRLDEAMCSAKEIKGDFWRPAAEASVVKLLARKAQHDQALKMATASKGNHPLVELGELYIESGDLRRTQAVAAKMADRMDYAKVGLLANLALVHHQAGRQKKTAAIFSQIEKIARVQKERIPRSDFLLRLAELSAKIEKPDRAVKLAMEALDAADDKHFTNVQRMLHRYFSHKVNVRARVFRLVLGLDRLELALKLAREQAEVPGFHAMGVTRSALMRDVAKALSDKGQTNKARSLIDEVKPSSTCGSRGLQSMVAVGYDKAGDESRALKLLEGMKNDERMWGICDLAEGRLKRDKFEDAMGMAERIEKPVFQASCLINLSEKALYAGREDWAARFLTRALKITRRKEMDEFRSFKLLRAGKLLFQMGRAQQALALIAEAAAAVELEKEEYRQGRWDDILGALADAGYCDLAVESTDRLALSKSRIQMAAVTCSSKQRFGAAVRLVLRLTKAEDRAVTLAKIGGLAAKDGWKPDPACLDLMRKKILDVKP